MLKAFMLETKAQFQSQGVALRNSENQVGQIANAYSRRAMELSTISGFWFTKDMEKYLGVPLLHGRKKK